MTCRLPPQRRRPRTLASGLVDGLDERLCDGCLRLGDKLPAEAAIMAEFGVSRSVVREARARLQASGPDHPARCGSVVEALAPVGGEGQRSAEAVGFRIDPAHCATWQAVVALL